MKDTATLGAIGVTCASTGAVVSMIPTINAVLQLISLMLGITIGAVTLWRLLRAKPEAIEDEE